MRPWPPALAHSPRRPPSLSCSPSRACARFNETLMRENELFESHLRRVNPQLLTSDDDAPGKSKRKGAAAAKKAQAVLAPEQKYEIASQEMEEVRDEIEAEMATKRLKAKAPASRSKGKGAGEGGEGL